MNLQELKQNIQVETDMSDIYSKIKILAESGSNEVYFNHHGNKEEDEISEVQVAILREQGYTVEWNRTCLWYEVSGWLQ
jgi:hypothetical protein